jgi:four helix bundle protein
MAGTSDSTIGSDGALPRKKDLAPRARAFALRIIHLDEALPDDGVARTIRLQVLRSGTSVGAHVAESEYAKSRADFTCKIDGAMQELSETRYWLDLLADAGIVRPAKLKGLNDEAGELMSIFVTMVKKTRRH